MNVIMSFLNAVPGTVTQGLSWGIMAIGVYLTFRVLAVSDLTVDGSLATGGAVCVILVRQGWNPLLAMLLAFLAGNLAGAVTALLHTKCGIPAILAGILTQLSLYSINLRIMSGRANQAVNVSNTPLFASQRYVRDLTWQNPFYRIMLVLLAVIAILYWFLGTELGCSIRATGSNPRMARAQGINTDNNIILTLMISNGLVALAGGIIAQYQGAADVNMGRGAIVIGLAAVIIGEVLFGKISKNFAMRLFAVALGAVVYYLVLQIVLQMGLNTNDLKLLSAVIVAIFLSIPHFRKNRVVKK